MDPTRYDEVAGLRQDQGRQSARSLITGVERKPIGLDKGVMHGVLVAVDEGDCITPTQIEISRIIVSPLLQHDADDVGQVGLSGLQREPSRREHEGPGEKGVTSDIARRPRYNLSKSVAAISFLVSINYEPTNFDHFRRANLGLTGDLPL